MASYRTTVWRGEDGDAMPTVLRQELPEGAGAGFSMARFIDPHADERRYQTRYVDDVCSEFRRAMRRRRFFTYWSPDMEAAS